VADITLLIYGNVLTIFSLN